jgi:hypothetical protein
MEETDFPYSCTALVISLSPNGAGLIAPRAFPRDSTFMITLFNRAKTAHYTRCARLVHGRPVSRGNWIMGCEFQSILEDGEFRDLLG